MTTNTDPLKGDPINGDPINGDPINDDLINSKAEPTLEAQSKQAWPIPVLREGEHYYMEDGYMVFTEAYHAARGRCCGNACRHCPFDHINVRSPS